MNPNGEVHTPPHLVKEIYQHLIPYLEPYAHIDLYEPGIGQGVFHQYYPFHSKTTYYGCDLVYDHHIRPIFNTSVVLLTKSTSKLSELKF